MQVKHVRPINFLFFRTETKVNELFQFIPVGQELIKEAVSIGLMVMGPVHWHYAGFTGDENQSFVLEISLPVGSVPEEYDGKFHFKRTEPFKCVSMLHEGGWLEIPNTYAQLFEFIAQQGLQPNALNREIYINADLTDPQANSTEIQIGVH